MSETSLINGTNSDDFIRQELLRMASHLHTSEESIPMTAARYLDWIMQGETEQFRGRRYTALSQAYSNRQIANPEGTWSTGYLLEDAEKFLPFLNGEI